MPKHLVGAAIAAAALFWVAASSGQDVRPVPGPGSGVVTVRGTVDVGSMPDVRAVQAGEWKVSVANTPNVRVAATTHLDFVRQGQRYRVIWAPDQTEEVVVAQLGSWGWIRVESKTGAAGSTWTRRKASRSVSALATGSTSKTPSRERHHRVRRGRAPGRRG